jgi:hypothetical protein
MGKQIEVAEVKQDESKPWLAWCMKYCDNHTKECPVWKGQDCMFYDSKTGKWY